MPKEIPLTHGFVTVVDDDLFDHLNQWKWRVSSSGYAVRHITVESGKKKNVYMHRLILQTPDGLLSDHINGNRLDNRAENLRLCNIQQNNTNRRKTKNKTSSVYKGVRKKAKTAWWCAYIVVDGKQKTLGHYETEAQAAYRYNIAAKEYFREFASLNDVVLPEDQASKINAEVEYDFKNYKPREASLSGIRGVGSHKSGKWQAKIYVNQKSTYLGIYETQAEASAAIESWRKSRKENQLEVSK